MERIEMNVEIKMPHADEVTQAAKYLGLTWNAYLCRAVFTMAVETRQVIPGIPEAANRDIVSALTDLKKTTVLLKPVRISAPTPEGGPDLDTVAGMATDFDTDVDTFFSACLLAYTRRCIDSMKHDRGDIRTMDVHPSLFGSITDAEF